jgi:hypothetical protein
MTHHLTNWDLLWFAVGGYTLCWLRSDRRLTRLARRVRHFEGQWRLCRVARDRASEAAAHYRRLADADRELFARLEQDFADRNDT